MEEAPKRDEEDIDRSRRGFLRGLGILGTAAAVGGVAFIAGKGEDDLMKESVPNQNAPYAVPVEHLTREEIMEEIVHDISRAQMLERFRDTGEMSGDTTLLEYFFERFAPEAPSRTDIEAEISLIEHRIADLRTHRDQKDPL